MDVSKIIELVNSLEDTWLCCLFNTIASGVLILCISTLVVPFFKSLFYCNLIRNLEKYMEFSLLRDFPEYVKTEKSAKWLEKVRLWFIRNS